MELVFFQSWVFWSRDIIHLYLFFLLLENIFINLDQFLTIVMQTLRAMRNEHLAALPVPEGVRLRDLLERRHCHLSLFRCD